MGDLVDPDPPQAGEQVGLAPGLCRNPLADAPRRCARLIRINSATALPEVFTASQATCCSKARVKREPWRAQGTAQTTTPCSGSDPRRVGLQLGDRRAEVERPPAATPLAKVEARGSAPADTAAITLPVVRPDRHHYLLFVVDLHALDDRPLQPEQACPYPFLAHVVAAPFVSSLREAGNLGAERRAPPLTCLTSPTETSIEPKIGRIASDGSLTEFSLPARPGVSGPSEPKDITVGPDGNLWFVEEAASRIGRIDTTGDITEFPLAPGRKPAGIVSAPDGALWFTEAAGSIGRITTTGEVTEFPLSFRGGEPSDITVGPDGSLWFAERIANRVGRITLGGQASSFVVPSPFGTSAIASGPDGNIWFASFGRVGSLRPDGSLNQLRCLKPSCRLPAVALAVGKEGAIWVGTTTEFGTYEGGYATMYTATHQPGFVAKLLPESGAISIGPKAQRVRAGSTTLRLSCEQQLPCQGTLRLGRIAPGFPAGGSPKTWFLGHRTYALASGESRRVSVPLNRRAQRLLFKRHKIVVWALTGTTGDIEGARLIRLQRGSKAPNRRSR